MKKKTNEEVLQEQGLKQVNIYDVMFPDEKKVEEVKNDGIQNKRQSSNHTERWER